MSSSHSELYPWDAINYFPKGIIDLKQGSYFLLSPDSFIQKVFFSKISESRKQELQYEVILGEEFSIDWIERNLLTLDLFQEKKAILVLNADKISIESCDYFLEKKDSIMNHCLILSSLKTCDFYKKCKKLEFVETFEVMAPKFWEGQKLLSFFCDIIGIRLAYDVQNMISKANTDNINILLKTFLVF